MDHSSFVKAFIILDESGSRVCAKYYHKDFKTTESQINFEKKLPKSTDAMSEDILIMDTSVTVFKTSSAGTIFYVVGSDTENELILTAVLDAAFEAISSLLRKQLDRRTLLDNLELVLLAVDELIDCGVILEIDQKAIKNRVLMQDTNSSDPNIGDMTISEAFEKAKEQASTPGFWSFGRKSNNDG